MQRRNGQKGGKYAKTRSHLRKTTFEEGLSIEETESPLTTIPKNTVGINKFEKYVDNHDPNPNHYLNTNSITTPNYTLGLKKFLRYCALKNKVNSKVKNFYKETIHRKLRLGSYIRTQKTDAKFLKEFKEKFGPPEDVIIGYGDWSEQENRKFQAPTIKPQYVINMFEKAGYPVYLVDEFRTSKTCCACGGLTETFRWVKNPRPYKRETMPLVKCHGLLRCTSCSRLFCRDNNGASNIWKCLNNAIKGLPRPAHLCRTPPAQP